MEALGIQNNNLHQSCLALAASAPQSGEKPPSPPIASALAMVQEAGAGVRPTRDEIQSFVQTNSLFAYVTEKGMACQRLIEASEKAEVQVKLSKLVRLFNEGPMTITDPFFRDEDFDVLVVLACISNRITMTQLGTAFYWKSTLAHYSNQEIHEVPLFLETGEVNPEARDFMRDGIAAKVVLYPKILSDEQLDDWFKEMRQKPASERCFLHTKILSAGSQMDATPDTMNGDYNQSPKSVITIMDRISSIGRKLFNERTLPDGSRHRVIPSMGMATTLYGLIGGHTKMVVRFGISESLRENGLRGERDVTVRSSFAEAPERADGFAAPYEEFTSHDLVYHLFLLSYIPKEFQVVSIALVDELRRRGMYDGLALAAVIEDMEFVYFSQFKLFGVNDQKDAIRFFLASLVTCNVHLCARRSIERLREIYLNSTLTDEEKKNAYRHITNSSYLVVFLPIRAILEEVLRGKETGRTPFEEEILAVLLEFNREVDLMKSKLQPLVPTA